MKELQFSTEKGEFLLLDGKDTITERLTELLKEYEHYAVVKEMKDADFSEVLDRSVHTGLFAHYVKDIPVNTYCYKSAMESLSSLIRSLEWYLFENNCPDLHHDKLRAESKTLYNPILLMKI